MINTRTRKAQKTGAYILPIKNKHTRKTQTTLASDVSTQDAGANKTSKMLVKSLKLRAALAETSHKYICFMGMAKLRDPNDCKLA